MDFGHKIRVIKQEKLYCRVRVMLSQLASSVDSLAEICWA